MTQKEGFHTTEPDAPAIESKDAKVRDRLAQLTRAQIAAGYALTLRLHHHWYLVTGISAYGCPKNDTLRAIDDGTL
jgi:hypothetical protein